MNYIGSKHRLSSFIQDTIHSVCGQDLSDLVFCDLFAGTGAVGRVFKSQVKAVIANDLEFYSYVLNRNYIGNHKSFEYNDLIENLNSLPLQEGFIAAQYGEGGVGNRLYFSEHNAYKIDSIRTEVEKWYRNKAISTDVYYFLLASLLESADKIANTASVYGSYLKTIKPRAAKSMVITPATFEITKTAHQVFQEDGNELITKISGDILYIDPPYNVRQYGANYHILNTIAKYNIFAPRGKTGLPIYNKSAYCSKKTVVSSFEQLIKNAQFKYIFVSYSNEGLMSPSVIKKVMEQYGRYDVKTTSYKRFRADRTASRHHKASSTIEYLHILEKQ